MYIQGLPCSSDGKESACNVGDSGSIPGSGRSSGEGNGNSLQHSCLKNPMGRGAWQAMVCGDMTEQLILLLYNRYNLKLYAKLYVYVYIELFSHVQLFWGPMNCSPPGSSVHGIFPGKNPRAGWHFLLQGIFPTPGLNPRFLHWQVGFCFFFSWAALFILLLET